MTSLKRYEGRWRQHRDLKLEESVFVFEREYALTDAENRRPVLWTAGILPCRGILLYAPLTKRGALAHILHPERCPKFQQGFEKTLKTLVTHLNAYGSSLFLGYIVTLSKGNLYDEVFTTQEALLRDNVLAEPFLLHENTYAILDTRDGQLCMHVPALKLSDCTLSYRRRMAALDLAWVSDLSKSRPGEKGLECCYEPKTSDALERLAHDASEQEIP